MTHYLVPVRLIENVSCDICGDLHDRGVAVKARHVPLRELLTNRGRDSFRYFFCGSCLWQCNKALSSPEVAQWQQFLAEHAET